MRPLKLLFEDVARAVQGAVNDVVMPLEPSFLQTASFTWGVAYPNENAHATSKQSYWHMCARKIGPDEYALEERTIGFYTYPLYPIWMMEAEQKRRDEEGLTKDDFPDDIIEKKPVYTYPDEGRSTKKVFTLDEAIAQLALYENSYNNNKAITVSRAPRWTPSHFSTWAPEAPKKCILKRTLTTKKAVLKP